MFQHVVEGEAQCSCLPRTEVENNLINGINPLGGGSKLCYQISSDLVYLYKKGSRDGNISILLTLSLDTIDSIWTDFIQEFVNETQGRVGQRTGQRQALEVDLSATLEAERTHERRVKSLGKVSQYNRKADQKSITCYNFS